MAITPEANLRTLLLRVDCRTKTAKIARHKWPKTWLFFMLNLAKCNKIKKKNWKVFVSFYRHFKAHFHYT